MYRLSIGVIISCIIAAIAYVRRSLTIGGSIAAVILGSSIYFFGDVFLSGIMVAFFLSSSVLTRFKQELKLDLSEINQKTGRRDGFQVAANGLIGIVYGVLFYFTNNHIFLLGYSVIFAAANSDTWASEVGVLSRGRTFSILNFRSIERGVSGGVSILGLFAAVFGAGFISVIFIFFYILNYGFNLKGVILFILVAAFGFLGSIIDSILGVVAQGKYRCRVCGKYTEKIKHHGEKTELVSGLGFITNDMVNIISTFLASLLAMATYIFI